MIIRKALYGLKSTGTVFIAHLAESLHDISFKPTKADPDVWIRPAVKPDATEYYKYICVTLMIYRPSHMTQSLFYNLGRGNSNSRATR